jgi:hypothetical protein
MTSTANLHRLRRAGVAAAALAALLTGPGCSSAPSAGEGSASPAGGASLFAWSAFPAPEELRSFAAECQPYVGEEGRAVLAALARADADLAHGVFLVTEDVALRGALGRALAAPGYAESQAIVVAEPARHAQGRAAFVEALRRCETNPAAGFERAEAAEEIFASLGDHLRRVEAGLLSASLALELGREAEPLAARVPAQQPGSALLELGLAWRVGELTPARFRAVARVAVHAGSAATLERLEALRTLGAVDPSRGEPAFALEWTRGLARSAINRRRPLLAVRHALAAVRAAEHLGRSSVRDRTRLAQAYLLADRGEAALVEAQNASEAADQPGDRAAALAVLGEALGALGRPEAAAEAYAAAQVESEAAGDGLGAYRHGLNRVLALLRGRDLEGAEAALAPLEGRRLRGAGARDLAVRRRIVVVLVDLLAARAPGPEAAERVERALADARAWGCVEVLAAYGSLPARLRP